MLTPSTARTVFAFSMIQSSCSSGPSVSAKHPKRSSVVHDSRYNRPNLLTLKEVQKSALRPAPSVQYGRLYQLEVLLDILLPLGRRHVCPSCTVFSLPQLIPDNEVAVYLRCGQCSLNLSAFLTTSGIST